MVTSSQAQFFDSLISVLSSPSSHNPLISLTHLPYPSPISHRYFASQLPSHGLAQLPSHGLIASLHLVLSLFFFSFFFWVQFVSIMWVCVCVYNFCVYVCIRICVCVCDFERENHKSEICVWFVILKGKIINLKFVFVLEFVFVFVILGRKMINLRFVFLILGWAWWDRAHEGLTGQV